ncbi:MAG: hypothetical protein A2Y77_16625 [Planctomycetes bacterium RBG_13_62_9]|nr:MAG: hypothetical protein A2Y77_16625 [Planctomycetes bacterium RBG_13_62_9]
MEDRTRENLSELLEQLFGAGEARTAEEDIRAGEQLLGAYPAPGPRRQTIVRIKAEMALAVRRRRRIRRIFHESLAAAAVIAFALIGLLDLGRPDQSNVFQAAIIPAALWDSDNIAADDLDLVYFNSEIRRIEAQLGDLQAGRDAPGRGAVEDVETELNQIETELWKGQP